ncbi:MAG: 23S rRNA (guanosine(2251)-2'-O)-methyltransferase RlmB [Kiritimatiellia bacterium]
MKNQRFHKRPDRKGSGRGGRAPAHGGGTEVLYGRQPVREMLLAGRRRIETFYLSPQVQEHGDLAEIIELANKNGVRIQQTDAATLDTLTGGGHHQGVAAVVSPFRYVSYKKMLSDAEQLEQPLFLFLDHLEDPQNVGSLLRTAEAAGVCGVVMPEHRAASITAAVVRASAGASEHMSVAQVPNLVRCMRLLQERGVWFAGLEGGEGSQDLTTVDLRGPLGIVVGSEGKGMRRLTRESCDYLVRLPMLGKVTSLNAAVAGAIALYEVVRQRREKQHVDT